MIKSELVKLLAAKRGIPEAEAKELVEQMLSLIADAITSGDSVMLTGFGKFEVEKKAAHTRELNGQKISVPEKYQVKFSLTRDMKRNEMQIKKDDGLKNLLNNIRLGDD